MWGSIVELINFKVSRFGRQVRSLMLITNNKHENILFLSIDDFVQDFRQSDNLNQTILFYPSDWLKIGKLSIWGKFQRKYLPCKSGIRICIHKQFQIEHLPDLRKVENEDPLDHDHIMTRFNYGEHPWNSTMGLEIVDWHLNLLPLNYILNHSNYQILRNMKMEAGGTLPLEKYKFLVAFL